MKHILMALMACAALCGCIKTAPDAATVAKTAKAVGKAAAYAANYVADKEVMTTIVTVVDKVQEVVPETNATFVAAWTPVIDAEFAKLVEAGKLKTEQAALAKTATLLAAEGIDYLFKANPTWKQYTDISQVAVKSFIEGFKSVVEKKSALSAPNGVDDADDYDKEAYKYLLQKAKK